MTWVYLSRDPIASSSGLRPGGGAVAASADEAGHVSELEVSGELARPGGERVCVAEVTNGTGVPSIRPRRLRRGPEGDRYVAAGRANLEHLGVSKKRAALPAPDRGRQGIANPGLCPTNPLRVRSLWNQT